jgi:hypothetical protein
MTAAFAAVLLATAAPAALAAPACTADALNALHVPNVTVTAARPVAATATDPALCDVQGAVATHGEGAPDGSANFAM